MQYGNNVDSFPSFSGYSAYPEWNMDGNIENHNDAREDLPQSFGKLTLSNDKSHDIAQVVFSKNSRKNEIKIAEQKQEKKG